MKLIAFILIACGLGLLIASLIRGYFSYSIDQEYVFKGESIKVLKGIWSPRNIYLSVNVNKGELDIFLYSNGKIVKSWKSTNGFIDRANINVRSYSYLLLRPLNNTIPYKVEIKITFYGLEKDMLLHAFILLISGFILLLINIIKRKYLLALCFIFLIFINLPYVRSKPNWLSKGVYAKYKGEGFEDILLNNGTVIFGGWSLILFWRYEGSENGLEKFLVNISIYGNTTFSFVDYVYIDTDSRKLYYNNREIGITSIFLNKVSSYKEKDRIFLSSFDTTKITGAVTGTRVYPITGYGYQKTIEVTYNFSRNTLYHGKKYKMGIYGAPLYYDVDTGILLKGAFELDPLLYILGITILHGGEIILVETNIDIGPSDTASELRYLLGRILYIMIIVAPIIVASYIIYRKYFKNR